MLKMENVKITREHVAKMAELCNLQLSEEELEKFSTYFTDTLTHIDVLDELSLNSVPETYQVTGLKNVFAKATDTSDTNTALTQAEALSTATAPKKGLFTTKGVFTE